VLLSTFNGEPFLADQLDSLSSQTLVDPHVFVRDDGSADHTLGMLAARSSARFTLAPSEGQTGLGPARSFLRLLTDAPDDFDHYGFCDQDDVWLPDKLARAVAALDLHAPREPALFCSRVRYVDAGLRPLGDSPMETDTRFEHLLFENIAHGNTVLMNAAARRLIVETPPVRGMIMHDWWCALVVSAFGPVIYDQTPRILYRQHGANVIGGRAGRMGEVAAHLRTFLRDPSAFYAVRDQAAEFLRLYGARLAPDQRRLVEALVASRRSLAARLAYGVTGRVNRRRPLDALAARLLLVAGRR
jgi:glycosyltransferase involved in cell wall biosynthesis